MSTLDHIFREFTENNSFNSTATVLRQGGENPPLSFGGNCIELSRSLKSRIDASTDLYSTNFVIQSAGVHQALVSRNRKTNQQFLLDPTVLHQEPIRIDDLQEGQTRNQSGQLTSAGKPLIFTTTKTPTGIVLRRCTYSDETETYIPRVEYGFSYVERPTSLHTTFERVFKDKRMLSSIFRTPKGIVTIKIDRRTNIVTYGLFSQKKSQSQVTNLEELIPVLELVAEKTEITVEELIQLYRKAIEIFYQNAYDDLD